MPARLQETDQLLRLGLQKQSDKHGLSLALSGPPGLPFITFSNESNLYRNQRFALEAINRGVFMHPHHNWFLCAAHREADIAQTLEVADSAFACVKEAFGD